MPDPVSGTGQAQFGIQNILKVLDSDFRRNDKKRHFLTFYRCITIDTCFALYLSFFSQAARFTSMWKI